MKLQLLTTIIHRTGTWPVYLLSEMTESDDKTYIAEYNSMPIGGRMVDTNWKSTGAAVAYLKRVANHHPDRSSIFVLVPYAGKFSIHFQDEDTVAFPVIMASSTDDEKLTILVPGYTVIPLDSLAPVEEVAEYDAAMPKTIGERVEKIARIAAAAQKQLSATNQVNQFGTMVQRYGGNLRRHSKARNLIFQAFDAIHTGIYEGKNSSTPLVRCEDGSYRGADVKLDEKKEISKMVATFPSQFALRAFPSKLCRIREDASYFSGGQMFLYVEAFDHRLNRYVDFAKATPAELQAAVLELHGIPDFKLAEQPVKSWAPEVIADNSGKWAGNALRFATKAEAEANVANLFSRWTLVRETRVVESTDEPNYRWVEGKGLEAIGLCPLCGERRGTPGTHKC